MKNDGMVIIADPTKKNKQVVKKFNVNLDLGEEEANPIKKPVNNASTALI